MQVYAGRCVGGPWDQKLMSYDKLFRVLYNQTQRGESAATVKQGEYRWVESDSKWAWFTAEPNVRRV